MDQPENGGSPSAMEVDPPAAAPKPSSGVPTGEQKLPPLTNIVPSIFVPLQEDITQPVDMPRDRIERLKWILKTIESQRAGVRENMLYLFERERDRILAEALEKETSEGPPETRTGLHPDEVDFMISNMEAPHQPEVNYNLQDIPPRGMWTQGPNATTREETVWLLLDLVEKAVAQWQGYDKHMNDNKDYYAGQLGKEEQTMAEMGKRPEERSKTGS